MAMLRIGTGRGLDTLEFGPRDKAKVNVESLRRNEPQYPIYRNITEARSGVAILITA